MRLRLVVVGLVTLVGQVVLLREVVVASFGSELIYLLAIGVQILGTAAGALVARREPRDPELRVRALFLAWALLLPFLVALARAARLVFGGTPGAYLPLGQQIAVIAIVLVPPGIAGGLLFTTAARAFVSRGGTLASAYAIESAGSLAGGIASTLLAVWGVQNLAVALLAAIFAALAAAIVAGEDRHRRIAAASWAVVVALGAASDDAPRIDRAMTRWSHPSLLETADTPYGRVTVTGSQGQVAVFRNGALAFESEGTSAEELAHLAALAVEEPRAALVLGGAVEGVPRELRKHRRMQVDAVELDARMVRLALRHLPIGAASSLRTRGTTLTFGDPRRSLERERRYDLIVSAMPEPDSGQANRFYTREFFRQCAARLEPGGVVAFRLRSSENLWTPALAARLASIDRALRESFHDVLVLPGTANVVLASNAPLPRDPGIFAERFGERGIEARLVSPRYAEYLLTNDRTAEISALLARTPAPVNSDARPVCYRFTLELWLSRFYPRAGFGSPGDLDPARSTALAVAVVLVAFGLARRSTRARRALLVGVAGFAGMAVECAIIVAYQSSRGVLYQDLGVLLAAFMAGLAAGSWLTGEAARKRARAGGAALLGSAILVAIATLATLAASRLVLEQPLDLLTASLLLAGAGLFTGALFAFASVRDVESDRGMIGPLYAADLAGGCAGTLAATLVLVPLAGLPATALVAGALALLAIGLL